MWKFIFDECRLVGGQRGVHRDPNAIAAQRAARFFFFQLNHRPEDAGW